LMTSGWEFDRLRWRRAVSKSGMGILEDSCFLEIGEKFSAGLDGFDLSGDRNLAIEWDQHAVEELAQHAEQARRGGDERSIG